MHAAAGIPSAPPTSTLAVAWDAPLGPLTSLRVGGTVRLLLTAHDAAQLAAALALAAEHRLPFAILGAGSNLLVEDGRNEAAVIRLAGTFRDVAVDGLDVSAGAAVRCGALARRLAGEGLAGLEFAAGIPGTIGGAVTMNAGYGGRSMADVLASATLLLPGGAPRDVAAAELELSYRRSRARRTGEIVLHARFRLEPGDRERLAGAIREGDRHRSRTQPLSAPSCGSVFKNPPGDHAGRLIDAAGLKGAREGGAEVSRLHANFIVTSPGATAADVMGLVARIQEEVRRRFGVSLEREVVLLSECLRAAP